MKKTGKRMQAIRSKLKLLQRDFAAELDISPASLSEIEAGNGKPRFNVIYNLTKKFNVNIYYLLHGKGEMFMADDIERNIVPETYGEHTEFLKTFLRYFNDSLMVRYAMMTHLRTYLIEKEHLIEKDVEKNKREKDKKTK